MTEERRKSSRVRIHLDALVVEHQCVEADRARVVNLSMSGALLEMESPIEQGKGVRLILKTAPRGPSMDVRARVVRRDHDGIAVAFLRLAPQVQLQLRGLIAGADDRPRATAA